MKELYSHNIISIGTVRGSQGEIPLEFLNKKNVSCMKPNTALGRSDNNWLCCQANQGGYFDVNRASLQEHNAPYAGQSRL